MLTVRPTLRRLLLWGGLAVYALAACGQATPALTATSHVSHAPVTVAVPTRDPAQQPPAPALDPSRGGEIGLVFEAYLSPQQEPGEERDTPDWVPDQFKSTAPSVLRNDRVSRGHGMVRFTRDLSRVYVDVAVTGVNPADIVMFHIHCGRPDMLGPIMVDLALVGDVSANFADGTFTAEITNEVISATLDNASGVVGAFTVGCPIIPGLPDKAKTVAGMAHIARQGELYFNLHTAGQTFYGDIRGQLYPVTTGP